LGYADDFIIIAARPDVAVNAGGGLARYLTECHAGPFHVVSDEQDARQGFHHVGCLFEDLQGNLGVECSIPDLKFDALIARMVGRIAAASADERLLGAEHFAAIALGPYGWAADWQKQQVRREAADQFEPADDDREGNGGR
jgi:hypothetical protein